MLDQIHYVFKMKFPEINELESVQIIDAIRISRIFCELYIQRMNLNFVWLSCMCYFQGIIVTEFFWIKGELMGNTSGLLENVKVFTCFFSLGSFFRDYFFFFLNNIPVRVFCCMSGR